MSSGKRFCWSCGGQLADPDTDRVPPPVAYTPDHLAERILTSKAALEGERKKITVLFADTKASLELLADRDPEEARKLLDPVLEHMMESVHRYEGTVNQLAGDGIMALFGAPLAHEDHAVRACYAALDMQAAIRRYAEQVRHTHGVELQIRVGLSSGEVVVRTIRSDLRMDYTAVGQTAHLAARMEQLATPGTIRLTVDTLRLAEGYFEVRSLGLAPVKGLEQPIDIYELIGARPRSSRFHAAAARGLTEFVGRENELEVLSQALARAAAGRGQVIAIVGEAGVGKSRLIWEVTHSHRVQGWLVLQAGSVSYGKATSYLPVVDLLKGYFCIEDHDEPRTAREKLTGKLLTLDRALESDLPALLSLLDVPTDDLQWSTLDPPQRRRRTLDSVKRLLLRESQVQPLLVVFEDLHWIDSETQSVLDELVESLPAARLLLLVNYRPEYQHAWATRTYYRQVLLDPLPTEGSEQLLTALLGSNAGLEPITHMLIARTEGNPFFLEESVRTLVEVGALTGERGAYQLARPLQAIQVPATVQDVIAARIDRLSATDKTLLQTASVLGKDVPLGLLQAIAQIAEDELHAAIRRLRTAEFLYEVEFFPDIEYTFKHALTHQVAYGSLLQERRRALHVRIMETIERMYPDRGAEHVDRLAHHAFLGEEWAKAVTYLQQVGLKAAARSAHGEAVGRFSSALKAIEHLSQSEAVTKEAFDLLFSLRTSLSPLGEYRRTFELLDEAETIARRLNDPARLARVFTFKSLCFWSVGRQDPAIDASEQALVTAQSVDELSVQVLSKMFAGRARHARGDYVEAIELLNWVIRATDGDRTNFLGMANLPSVAARAWLSWSLAERGEFELALMRSDEAVYIADAIDQFATRIYAYMALGIVHLRKGSFDFAIQPLDRAFQLSERADLRMARAMVAGYLGRAYTLTNQVSRAIEILNQAVTAAAGMELMVDQAMRLMHLGEAYLHDNQVEKATDIANLALQNALNYHQRGAAAWIHWLLGEINARSDFRGAAEDHYSQAEALASQLGMAPLLAHCHFGLKKAKVARAGPNSARGIASQRRLRTDS